MEEIMIQTVLTRKDVKTASYYNVFARGALFIALTWLPFLIGLAALIFQDFFQIHALICAAFMLYSVVMTALQFRRAERLFRRRKGSIGQEHVVQVGEEEIRMEAPEESLKLDWGDIREVRELSGLFLLYTSVRRLIYLPKRDMTEEQIIALRGLVRNKLAYKYYRLKA